MTLGIAQMVVLVFIGQRGDIMYYYKGDDGYYVVDKVKTRHDAVQSVRLYKKFKMWYIVNDYLMPKLITLLVWGCILVLLIKFV